MNKMKQIDREVVIDVRKKPLSSSRISELRFVLKTSRDLIHGGVSVFMAILCVYVAFFIKDINLVNSVCWGIVGFFVTGLLGMIVSDAYVSVFRRYIVHNGNKIAFESYLDDIDDDNYSNILELTKMNKEVEDYVKAVVISGRPLLRIEIDEFKDHIRIYSNEKAKSELMTLADKPTLE